MVVLTRVPPLRAAEAVPVRRSRSAILQAEFLSATELTLYVISEACLGTKLTYLARVRFCLTIVRGRMIPSRGAAKGRTCKVLPFVQGGGRCAYILVSSAQPTLPG